MTFLKNCYYAIRYGEWAMGWEQYEGKPQFALCHDYYDGHHVCFHCYKLWVGVFYF